MRTCCAIRHTVLLLIACCCVCCLAYGAQAAPQKPVIDERSLTALFIKKIPNYVSWPEQERNGHTFSALSVSPLAPYFSLTPDDVTPQRPLLLRWPSAECQILFVNSKDSRKISATLKGLGTAPVLTVSDSPEFMKLGGMIQLVKKKGRMALRINPEAVSRSGLRISSRLLRLAEIYKGAD